MVKKILDVGCGRGAKISYLETRGKTTGIDISAEFINNCRELFPNSDFYVMDALKMNFRLHNFDEVYCLDVIEHVENPGLLLKKVFGVLKPNGKLYLDFPYFNSEKILSSVNRDYLNDVHHHSIFLPNEIINLLNKTGFKIVSRRFTKFFDNIYLLTFFLRGRRIQNQQGDFRLTQPVDNLLSFLAQFIYTENYLENFLSSPDYLKMDKISQNEFGLTFTELAILLKISDTALSPYFPKTISLICSPVKNPQNNLSDFTFRKNKLDLSVYLEQAVSFFRCSKDLRIPGLMEENNRLRSKLQELKSDYSELKFNYLSNKNELDIVKDSKLFKLWPIYNKLKKILRASRTL